MPDDVLAQRIELALSQSKGVERDARSLKQSLGALREEYLQSKQTQGEQNASTKEDR